MGFDITWNFLTATNLFNTEFYLPEYTFNKRVLELSQNVTAFASTMILIYHYQNQIWYARDMIQHKHIL